MKGNLKVLTALVAGVMMLSACGSNEPNTSSKPASTTKQETTQAPADTSATTSGEVSKPANNGKYELGGDMTTEVKELYLLNKGNQVRLAGVFDKLNKGEEVTIGYIGGSITQGSGGGSESYANNTTSWFESKYPSAKITSVNAGIGATGSFIGVHRADEDLLAKKPDIVFVEFSVNDTTEHTERNKQSYDGLLRKIWNSESKPAIVTIAMTQENGTSFQDQHYEIAKKYDLPMISYKNAVLGIIEKDYIVWKDISDDNIHPNVPGHKFLSDMITDYLADVGANYKNITGDESDFSTPAVTDLYDTAKILRPSESLPKEIVGFEYKAGAFGGFQKLWNAKSEGGDYKGAKLVFEVDAKSIGILYGKRTSGGGKAEVKVDGEVVATLNSDFKGGWGNYVETAQLATFETSGKHTVEIIPVNSDTGTAFLVSGLLVS